MKNPEQNEKVRLELLEKKIEIQKMRIDIRKGKLNIDDQIERRQLAINEQRLLIEKTSELRNLLSGTTIDKEKNILSSEPFYTPIIYGTQRNIIMNKLIELVNKF